MTSIVNKISNLDTKYIFLFFIIIIYFLYGLTLSEVIDYIFPDHDETLPDYRIALEIIGEIGIAYIIYFSLQKYSEQFIIRLLNSISTKSLPLPKYLNQILLFSFSTGIFKHLQKSANKVVYFRKKILNW